jgi:hypothetical protein
MIRYLKHSQIDKEKWDKSLSACVNKLIYAQSWYLDIVSLGWHALVDDDFAQIMPLPHKSKLGLPYLVQPKYTQQLGVFSPTEPDVRLFLKKIPPQYLWRNIHLNYMNLDIQAPHLRTNIILPFDKEYADIRSSYNENTRRNISKARKNGCCITSASIEDFINAYALNAKDKPLLSDVQLLERLIREALNRNLGCLTVATSTNGDILAGSFFLYSYDRLIYHTSFSSSEGQKHSASFLVIDETIRRHCKTMKLLDFEGSMLTGIARFFRGFGGIDQNYPTYKGWMFEDMK